ncbi:MAG: TonB family protein [Acidobacteria bacterium]|nr:TonB family protein [Acidobacteriota bacterium]
MRDGSNAAGLAGVLCMSLLSVPAFGAVEEVAVVKTSFGDIVWRFLPEQAPGHTAYVKELIGQKFYDGTTFHRVIPHFVAQGGDPNSTNADRADDGNGEAGRRLKAEFSQTLHYRPGTVGMARDSDPDSGSCQFFIALENIPRLDGKYTIFGEVVAGLEVARAIADAPRDLNDNPLTPVPVTISVQRRAVPPRVYSLEPAESGEVLTGPLKPKFYDARNVLWTPPKLKTPAAPASPATRVDIAVGTDGKVLDVRFASKDVAGAGVVRQAVMAWAFEPALFEGTPVKVRIEINTDGTAVGPPTGGGAPQEIAGDIVAPRLAVRVDLAVGEKVPDKPCRLRLIVDPAGKVADASIQSTSGSAELDRAAVAAAREMIFKPATTPAPPGSDPEPVAVYLDIDAVFIVPPGP